MLKRLILDVMENGKANLYGILRRQWLGGARIATIPDLKQTSLSSILYEL